MINLGPDYGMNGRACHLNLINKVLTRINLLNHENTFGVALGFRGTCRHLQRERILSRGVSI